ncbi:MAG: GNAT family protein [Nanoarchaeota archaeon]
MKNAFLVSNRIYLAELALEDITERMMSWYNNPEACTGNGQHIFPKPRQDPNANLGLVDYINSVSINSLTKSKHDYFFAIKDKLNDQHVGNITLQSIDWISRNAEITIMIGEKDYRGKGVGEEAWKLIMNYGFNTLNLNRLQCGTFSNNISMQKIAVKCGMKEEGRRLQAAYKNGEYLDVLLYGAVKGSF